jgi:hypothetical protein
MRPLNKSDETDLRRGYERFHDWTQPIIRVFWMITSA